MLYFTGAPLSVTENGRAKSFEPKWLLPDSQILREMRHCREYESLADFCRGERPRQILLHRTYALGDILMLLPLARAFHRMLSLSVPILIAVGHRHWGDLREMRDPRLRVGKSIGCRNYGADVHLDLNSCLEADHRGGPESDLHRIDLYARALGIPLAEIEPRSAT